MVNHLVNPFPLIQNTPQGPWSYSGDLHIFGTIERGCLILRLYILYIYIYVCVCISKLPQFIAHGESIVKKNGWLILSHWKAEMFSVHVRPPGGPRPHPWRRRERTTKAPICQTSPGGTSWRSDQDLTQQKLGFSSSKSVSGLIFKKKKLLEIQEVVWKTPTVELE